MSPREDVELGDPVALMETVLDRKVMHRGKVRDTYELDDERLLMVATDRISAFDHVLPNGIPDRGKVLTQLSIYWFGQTHHFQENHLISGMVPDLPGNLVHQRDQLRARFMIVRKAKRVNIECVVRGYLAGSAWEEYKETGAVAGEKLPAGLQQSERLPVPLFTPATKALKGHDENITFAQMKRKVGKALAEKLRDASLELYKYAAEMAEKRGLILADTKFEFGTIGKKVILIDEALTPDSSRYWDAARYQVGGTPESYDKQFVRDWLSKSGWDRNSEPPRLPDEIVDQTRQRYLTAYHMVVGKPLFPPKERNE